MPLETISEAVRGLDTSAVPVGDDIRTTVAKSHSNDAGAISLLGVVYLEGVFEVIGYVRAPGRLPTSVVGLVGPKGASL